jgi:murein DD-endopeptidase MepM/ murein hydrolase activator NlpD
MLKKLILNIFFISLVSCSGLEVLEKFEPKKELKISPGQLKLIDVPPLATKISCGEEVILPSHNPNRSYYVFAESYFSSRKVVSCEIFQENKKLYEQKISVITKNYPFETLSVNPKRVKLNKKDLKRVIKERKVLKKIYGNFGDKLLVDKKFSIPLQSKVTSFYGTRRLFNNVRKSQHLGIDYRAKVGVLIPSSNKGTVVLAQDLFYTGNTVIIDHGLGIFTLYGHLSKILVNKGDIVERLEILGQAGKTGRVTGPHLHWGVKVNGHWVDGDILSELKLP